MDIQIINDNSIWHLYENYYSSIIIYILSLFVFCTINIISYMIIDIILGDNVIGYGKLNIIQKRYTQKNLTKSLILLLILIMGLPNMFVLFVTGKWQNEMIHFLGTIYVSTDLTGLIMIPKLSIATKIHHYCVLVFGTISVLSDYNKMGIHRAMVTLTLLSAIPYLVNGYLGLRYLENKNIKDFIINICLYTYILSVVANFIIQHLYVCLWLPSGFLLIKLPYIGLYYLIVYDDLNLIKYLWYKHSQLIKN